MANAKVGNHMLIGKGISLAISVYTDCGCIAPHSAPVCIRINPGCAMLAFAYVTLVAWTASEESGLHDLERWVSICGSSSGTHSGGAT